MPEQTKAGEFQVFSYVSPQQRRGNKSKGTTAFSFSTWAVSIISLIHLLKRNLLSRKINSVCLLLTVTSSWFSFVPSWKEKVSSELGFSEKCNTANQNCSQSALPEKALAELVGTAMNTPKSSPEGRKVRTFSPEKTQKR